MTDADETGHRGWSSAETIDVSVVIPCFNCEGTLRETLEALCAQEWEGGWEILLSDNRCTDSSMEVFRELSRRYPGRQMRVVDASERRGQPHALNVGVNEARGRSVVFCDADDVVAPGWLAAMARALDEYEFVAARMDLEKLNEAFVRSCCTNRQVHELQRIAYPPYLPHAGGGTLGFRRSLFRQIGGFDHGLPILHDTDFCFRAQMAGVELHYVPEAVIYIRLRSDRKGIRRQGFNYAKYNVILSKRYRAYGQPAPRRWRRFARLWISVGQLYMNTTSDKETRARASRTLGWAMGLTAGVMSQFVPPP